MTPEQEARIRALADELSEVRGGSVHFRAQEAKRYGKDLTALLAEVDRLRADKARLDFLDEANRRLNAKYGTTYRWKLIMNHNVNRLMIGHMDVDLNDAEPNALKSCRDAIDEKIGEVHAARAALSPEPKGESNG